MLERAGAWMREESQEAGYLYVDGHVRTYTGQTANLPRRYVSREQLCLRGTTDYWVNDALGRPFFVVSKSVTEGLAATLLEDILPDLLQCVPEQPTEQELAADPTLHRFVMVFDREGATHALLSKLWGHRVAAITYRKAVKDLWPENEFQETEVAIPGAGSSIMLLATRQSTLCAGDASIPVIEVRKLCKQGHQTVVISSAMQLSTPVVAGRMFARWCQENFFAYMMQHYDIDGLVQYGVEELPGTVCVVNPAWRVADQRVRQTRGQLQTLEIQAGQMAMDQGADVLKCAQLHQRMEQVGADLEELRQRRKGISRKIALSELPEAERPNQLRPLRKALVDTVKMIAYRAETALVGLLRRHLNKPEDGRGLIRELFSASADIVPDPQAGTLTIQIHPMACSAHDKAIGALLMELTAAQYKHPQTQALMIFQMA
jgi:prepilin-type processing-associated H-X9-DG protein